MALSGTDHYLAAMMDGDVWRGMDLGLCVDLEPAGDTAGPGGGTPAADQPPGKVELPASVAEYTATGVSKTIDSIIASTGYQIALTRCGPNAWEINHCSAKINITYHERTGLMTADAILCQLPKDNIKPLYEYLLRENYHNEALTLSLHEQDILLSLLIFDRYLNHETGMNMLQTLFEKADHYDNILVEQYGATWKSA